jgi:hypothetical protein
MLEAARNDRIVTGAYTDNRGGACPLLAAHRRGGRTNAPAFADAWDAFTGATRARAAKPAEIAVLRTLLAATLPPAPQPEPAAPKRPAPRHRTHRFRRRKRIHGLQVALGIAPVAQPVS